MKSGTLIRKGAKVTMAKSLDGFDKAALTTSIDQAFGKRLKPDFLKRPVHCVFMDSDYRGGAILTQLAGLPYLSKFWVTGAAKGEGLARDIWDKMCAATPAFFWRSRRDNPFSDWYMKQCDGMQTSGEWRVFWIGLEAPEVPGAIIAASSADEDFEQLIG